MHILPLCLLMRVKRHEIQTVLKSKNLSLSRQHLKYGFFKPMFYIEPFLKKKIAHSSQFEESKQF